MQKATAMSFLRLLKIMMSGRLCANKGQQSTYPMKNCLFTPVLPRCVHDGTGNGIHLILPPIAYGLMYVEWITATHPVRP
jgi:hypothetical protein